MNVMYQAMSVTVLTKLVAFSRILILLLLVGFSAETDVFFYILQIHGLVLFAGNVIDTVGIPNIAQAHSTEDRRVAIRTLWRQTLQVAGWSSIALLVAGILVPSFTGFDMQAKKLLVTMILLSIPHIIFTYIFHYYGILTRAKKQYRKYYTAHLLAALVYTSIFLAAVLLNGFQMMYLPLFMCLGTLAGVVFLMHDSSFLFESEDFRPLTKKKLLTPKRVQLLIFLGFFLQFILTLGLVHTMTFFHEKVVSSIGIALVVVASLRGILSFEHTVINQIVSGQQSKTVQYLKFVFELSLIGALIVVNLIGFIFEVMSIDGVLFGIRKDVFLPISIGLLMSVPFQVLYASLFKLHTVFDLEAKAAQDLLVTLFVYFSILYLIYIGFFGYEIGGFSLCLAYVIVCFFAARNIGRKLDFSIRKFFLNTKVLLLISSFALVPFTSLYFIVPTILICVLRLIFSRKSWGLNV